MSGVPLQLSPFPRWHVRAMAYNIDSKQMLLWDGNDIAERIVGTVPSRAGQEWVDRFDIGRT